MNKKIDMAKFMKECMLTNDDKKQMRSLDNKRVNLDYYNEDELDDVAVDDYSECDGREKIETLGDIGMGIF